MPLVSGSVQELQRGYSKENLTELPWRGHISKEALRKEHFDLYCKNFCDFLNFWYVVFSVFCVFCISNCKDVILSILYVCCNFCIWYSLYLVTTFLKRGGRKLWHFTRQKWLFWRINFFLIHILYLDGGAKIYLSCPLPSSQSCQCYHIIP